MTNRRQKKAVMAAQHQAIIDVAPPSLAKRKPGVSMEAVLQMRHKPRGKTKLESAIFAPYEPPKGVLPSGRTGKGIAMDAGFAADSAADSIGLMNINAAFDEGYAWPGFTILANWAQISEFRKPAEAYAREMTRKWIRLVSTGDEEDSDKTDKLKKIDAEFKRLNVQARIREAIEQDGFFGRAQIFIDVGIESDQIDSAELKTDLAESPTKVGIGSLKRLVVVEPIWSYPNRYNANDPLDPTFYKPISWFVMGKEIHSSRLLTIVTREVPDILKPAYAFAGLSLSQMMKPYIDNWLRTRQSVSDLVHSFTVWTLSTDMSSILNNGGAEDFFNRLQIFNLGRDNHGVNAINKDSEEFSNVSANLAGLKDLQAQAQEQMCAPSGVPLVYLTGITPSGLNASSDGEIRVFQDTISANQEIYTPVLSKILNLVQLSLFGEVDPEIGFVWNPLFTLSDVELATLDKTNAEAAAIRIDSGVIDAQEEREKLAAQEDSPYANLDLGKVIEPPENPADDPFMKSDGQSDHEEE